MSLEKIIKKISDNAEAEVRKIIDKSKQEAEEIKKKAGEEASNAAEEYLSEEERRRELEANRIVTKARMDKKMKILFCKKEIIDEILDAAFKEAIRGKESLKKRIIMKEGEKEGALDKDKLKDELRPEIERSIAEDLKL